MLAALFAVLVGILSFASIALSMHDKCNGCSKAKTLKNFFLTSVVLSAIGILALAGYAGYSIYDGGAQKFFASSSGGTGVEFPATATLFLTFAGILTYSAFALKMHDECGDCSQASSFKNFFLGSTILTGGGILGILLWEAYAAGKESGGGGLAALPTTEGAGLAELQEASTFF